MGVFEDFVNDILMNAEGGYSNDPDDKGGATDLGVTQAVYDEYRNRVGQLHQQVSKITKDEAWAVYRYYWGMGASRLEQWPSMAIQYFDACFNSGPGHAARFLQQALGITEDGVFGPGTLRVATQSLSRAERWWSENFAVKRIEFLVDINKPKYEKGWLLRAVRVASYALARVAK